VKHGPTEEYHDLVRSQLGWRTDRAVSSLLVV
jgi:hypothetical protein